MTAERVGTILLGLASVLSLGAVIEMWVKRPWRWTIGAPIVFLAAILFALQAGGWGASHSGIWVAAAIVGLGVPALVFVVFGARRAGLNTSEPIDWTPLLSAVVLLLLGGGLLMITREPEPVSGLLTTVAIIVPIALAVAYVEFAVRVRLQDGKLATTVSIGFLLLSWILVGQGASPWSLAFAYALAGALWAIQHFWVSRLSGGAAGAN